MSEKIGYVGRYKGYKIFFSGEFYYAEVNGLNMVLDKNKADEDVIRWTPGC